MLVSYDTLGMGGRKVGFILRWGLGGAMWWEASGDKVGEGSLIGEVGERFAGVGLDGSENLLSYEGSRYDNLRGGMVGE